VLKVGDFDWTFSAVVVVDLLQFEGRGGNVVGEAVYLAVQDVVAN